MSHAHRTRRTDGNHYFKPYCTHEMASTGAAEAMASSGAAEAMARSVQEQRGAEKDLE